MWGYLSDESIDSMDDATIGNFEMDHEYNECPGGTGCTYTARECVAHVRRLRKKAKRPRTAIAHKCPDANESHTDGHRAVARIHERACSALNTAEGHNKMSLYGCKFLALGYLHGKSEARPQMPKNLASNLSIKPLVTRYLGGPGVHRSASHERASVGKASDAHTILIEQSVLRSLPLWNARNAAMYNQHICTHSKAG